MNKDSEWIDLDQAHAALADQHLLPITDDWLLAISSAWEILEAKLASGNLLSRVADPTLYTFLFRSDGETRAIDLLSENKIANDFWWHFKEARELSSQARLLVDEGEASVASRRGTRFSFVQREGIRDAGILEGDVDRVQILRSGLPILSIHKHPRRRGRPPGVGGYAASDEVLVQRALILAKETGENSPHRLAKIFADSIDGFGTIENRIRRLEQRISDQLR